MNKKLLLFGALIVAGFMTLTAFGGKTKEQQQAEINQAIQTQLDAFRQEQVQMCTDRVTAEAQKRYDEAMAAAAATAKPGTMVKKTVKKSGAKADPLPQATAPAKDPQKTRGGAVQQGDAATQKTRSGAVEQNTTTKQIDPAAQKTRGGAVKQGGGGQ